MTVAPVLELNAKNNITPVLGTIEKELQKFGASVEGNTRGIRKLENSFESMAVKSLGLQGNVGMLADSLIEFAPGGFIGIAVAGGIAAMVTHFNDIKAAVENSRKQVVDLRIEFLRLSGDVVGADLRAAAETAKRQFKDEDRLIALRGRVEALRLAYESSSGAAAVLAGSAYMLEAGKLVKAEEQIFVAREATNNASKVYTNSLDTQTKKTKDLLEQKEKEDAVRKTEIQLLIELSKLRSLTGGEVSTLISAEVTMKDKLNDTNLSYQKQIDLLTQLNAVQATIKIEKRTPKDITKPADTETPSRKDKSFTVKPVSISPVIEENFKQRERERQAQVTGAAAMEERMQKFQLIAMVATDALSAMGEAIANGENAFNAFGRSAANAISGILKALAKQNIVEGLSALGKAFFAASNPATAAAAPGFFTAAGYHFAAAAAAGVGAGVAAAGASGGGAGRGGVGGAGGVNNSNLGRSSAAGQGTVTVNITGGGILDMNNIDTQRSFIRALESITNKRAIVIGA